MADRINTERTEIYPSVINDIVNDIKLMARREVATLFSKIQNTFLKFSKPFTYSVNNNLQNLQNSDNQYSESIAGSDVGSIMDLADFENTL